MRMLTAVATRLGNEPVQLVPTLVHQRHTRPAPTHASSSWGCSPQSPHASATSQWSLYQRLCTCGTLAPPWRTILSSAHPFKSQSASTVQEAEKDTEKRRRTVSPLRRLAAQNQNSRHAVSVQRSLAAPATDRTAETRSTCPHRRHAVVRDDMKAQMMRDSTATGRDTHPPAWQACSCS